MSDLKMAREALEKAEAWFREYQHHHAKQGALEKFERNKARADELLSVLSALSTPEAAPASPSPRAWTEERLEHAFHVAKGAWATGRSEADSMRIGLSTLNATPPAKQSDNQENRS